MGKDNRIRKKQKVFRLPSRANSKEKAKRIDIVFKIKAHNETFDRIECLIENKVIALQAKYPYADFRIEVSI